MPIYSGLFVILSRHEIMNRCLQTMSRHEFVTPFRSRHEEEDLCILLEGYLTMLLTHIHLTHAQEGLFIHDIDSLTLMTNPKALNGSHIK